MPESAHRPGQVLRNTLILIGARLLGAPLSMLVSVVMGRYLGAADFGYIFLASTQMTFGFLLVDWGHSAILQASVARERDKAGVLLATSLAWRFTTAIIVSGILSIACWRLGYPPVFQMVLALVALQFLFNVISSACQDVVRGFERTDVSAYAQVGTQLLGLVFVVPALLLGGKLGAALIAQAAASAIVMLAVGVFTGKMRLGMFRFDPGVLTTLFKSGSSFMIFGFALALQPNVDMLFLSKLSSAEVVGWQAAAQRVMSVVMMPASAVVAALYPTLARLHAEDPRGYRETTSRALQATFVLAVPMALGCALYRDIATQLFSRKLFGPIQMNLLVLSALVFLLYVSMPLGAAILAAGRQRRFAVVQTLCVIVSLVLDPLLIPLFQRRYNNGGIGVCVAGVVSEVLMVGGGIFLIPEGVIDRPLLKSMGKGILAGAAMIGVARILNGVTPYAAGPVVLVSYFVALFLVGGVDRQQIESARQAIAQKVRARTS